MTEPYRVEPAKSGRSTCKVSKEMIEKGELRFGSMVDIGGHATYHWRKLKCISGKQAKNFVDKVGAWSKIGGYDEISPKQQKQICSALDKALKSYHKTNIAKAKLVAAKEKAKAAKAKAKDAKAKAKAKILAVKEAKKAKAMKGKPAAAIVLPTRGRIDAGSEPAAKRARVAVESDDESAQ
mmetsp:Transcript_94499/g.149431  ORF Transcript_94499/g.149431 Transcript_94499/m.149431 type:complete len:181 (+) Transcript_94499:57-599(+)